ncbi:HNH endonuclease [Streptomyces sp. NRRL B-1347]|uniref:HNH endonuclease n=1 Tax=Streptomyces sp. NRRL B-1347 TaxID=1476877 RepID=UPI00131ACB53
MTRDGYVCRGCGEEASEVDHVRPLWEGGSDDLMNLVAVCKPCHMAKSKAERLKAYQLKHKPVKRLRDPEENPYA